MQPGFMNFPCPQCGQAGPDSWISSPEVFALMKVTKGEDLPVKFISNAGFGVKPYICATCGFTVLFKATLDDISDD